MSRTPPFLIVADRGRLLSYRLDTNGRNSVPQLVESLEFMEGRMQMRELVTDRMGAFPNGGTAGQGNSVAERMTLADEISTRTIRNVAGRMAEFLEKHAPATWGFAAPAHMNSAFLDEMPAKWRKRLSHNLSLDLTRVPATELLEHFED